MTEYKCGQVILVKDYLLIIICDWKQYSWVNDIKL